MNVTTHPVAPEEIMAFLDGELSAADAQAVSTHLERCAECTRVAAQFRKTSEDLMAWTAANPASSWEAFVLQAAKGDKPSASKTLLGKPVFRWPHFIPARWRPAAILVAILIAVGVPSSFYLVTARKAGPPTVLVDQGKAARCRPLGTLCRETPRRECRCRPGS